MNVIETNNLTKIYGNSYIALNGTHLQVPQGAVFGLIGPNGAGKTTTIRLLLGLHTPSAGTVQVFGEPMNSNAIHLRQRMGYLPTNPKFPADMNLIAYLDFVGKLFGMPSELRKPRLASLLRAVGLLGAASQKIKSLSTGMTTRLGIAASLMNDPELLIWDEPTAGLDPEGRKYTIQLMHELSATKTILVSSHDLGELEKVCTHIGVLSDGKLIFNGAIGQMKQFQQTSVITLDLHGDIATFCEKLTDMAWERIGDTIRLTIDNPDNLAPLMLKIMTLITQNNVKLVGLQASREEMIDAFIRLMKEERSHGFSQIMESFESFSGNSGSRFAGNDALVGGTWVDSPHGVTVPPDDSRRDG